MKGALKTISCLLLLMLPFEQNIIANNEHDTVKDTLVLFLQTTKDDTNKVNILNTLSRKLYNIGNYDSSFQYANSANILAEKIAFKRGLATSFKNIGNVYLAQGNYPKALNNYFASLKINEEIDNKIGIATLYNNIGSLYDQQSNYSEALKYHIAALKIRMEIGDKKGIADSYGNIGNAYCSNNYPEALKSYFAALKIYKEIGDTLGIAGSYANIGSVYQLQGNFTEALKTNFACLNISEAIGDKQDIDLSLCGIGATYDSLKNFKEAEEYSLRSLKLAKEIDYLDLIKSSNQNLSAVYAATGRYEKALECYKAYIAARDSLQNEENLKKTIRMQVQYEFDKKQVQEKLEQVKKDVDTKSELRRQKLMIIAVSFVLLLLLVIAAIIFRTLKVTRRQKQMIEAEKQRSDELLLNIFPAEIAKEIKQYGRSKAKTFGMVSVMFTDFKDFTAASEKISPELLVEEIDYCFCAFDRIIQKFNIEKIKTVGDAYMCVSGMPVLTFTHSIDIVNAALEIRDFILQRRIEKESKGETSFELRIGIHTGPVVAGVVGLKKFVYDIWGDTVNIAHRMESSGEPGKVNISEMTYNLIKDKFACTYRGKISAKHKGEIGMYFVEKV
jgi:adenylate cyclase